MKECTTPAYQHSALLWMASENESRGQKNWKCHKELWVLSQYIPNILDATSVLLSEHQIHGMHSGVSCI